METRRQEDVLKTQPLPPFLKKPKLVSTILAGLLSLTLGTAFAWSATLGSLRLSYTQGDVQVRTGDTQDWVAAAANIPLVDGDNIWSPEGAAAEVQVLNGTCVRIAENSSLSVVTFGKNTSQFSLDQGNAYVNTRGGRNSLFQFDTPSVSVRVFGKAIFEVDVSTEGYTDVSVLAGSLSVESESGAVTISQGQALSIKQDGVPKLLALSPPDDWTRWNQERDRMVYQHRASVRYLPPELQPYSSDFDQNGQWADVPDYGYVWTPTAVARATWSPYRDGRWCWMGGHYVWVPYEPWGWCPYHYGRWAFIGSLGWCWVPPRPRAVFWAPAYVGWVRTPDHVAWVPLAPGEIYYGRGHYGPNSVNITKVNVTNIVINKTYQNVNVHNGVIAATRETFLTGRGEHARLSENPFLTHRASVGPPAIKPERQTFMPSLKTIPRSERPPEHLTTVIPRGMERPLPAERRLDRSVMRPAQPQQQMPVQKPREKGPAAGIRQKAEKVSPPVPERTPTIERPPRLVQPTRPETGPSSARPAPSESTQRPPQAGGIPRATQPAAPGTERSQPGMPPMTPQAVPKATRPEAPTQPGRPGSSPRSGQPERGPEPARPEGTALPPRPSAEARPVAPPIARPPMPETRPVAPPTPSRPPTPEVRPLPPPAVPPAPQVRPAAQPPLPSAPSHLPPQAQPAPAPRPEVRQSGPADRPPEQAEHTPPSKENLPGMQQQQHREGR